MIQLDTGKKSPEIRSKKLVAQLLGLQLEACIFKTALHRRYIPEHCLSHQKKISNLN